MKRHGQLMPAIATFSNVAAAFHRAAAGRRQTRLVQDFASCFDASVNALVRELASGGWQPGGYERFTVRDPKLRVIHAAPFRDRVVHHALMGVAGPLLESSALPHSHACRTGKGNLAAVHHAARCTRRHAFFLKLDVRRFFDSIPHATLLALLRRKFKDGAFLAVMQRVIGSFAVRKRAIPGPSLLARGRNAPVTGLPIGTLTSQYLANFFLDGLDRWIVETEPQAPTASCAAAPGTTRRGTAAPPSATGTSRATGTTTWACACPQLTRAAAAARLTRSPEPDGTPVRDTRPPGAGRDAGWRLPNAPGGSVPESGPHSPLCGAPPRCQLRTMSASGLARGACQRPTPDRTEDCADHFA